MSWQRAVICGVVVDGVCSVAVQVVYSIKVVRSEQTKTGAMN